MEEIAAAFSGFLLLPESEKKPQTKQHVYCHLNILYFCVLFSSSGRLAIMTPPTLSFYLILMENDQNRAELSQAEQVIMEKRHR